MLGFGVAAQSAGTFVVSTPAFLIPMLHLQQGVSLADAGMLAAAPTFGMVLTLVAWGALADRIGERWVIAGGLALTAVLTAIAASTSGFVALGLLLVLAGAASASTNSASGRIVVGWFPRQRRGLAMGIRQMSQPLGVALAAIVVPTLAENYGVGAPFLAAAIALAVLTVACAVAIANPPRPVRAATSTSQSRNPYANGPFLVRIHIVSILLVIPQFTLSTFGLVWLVGGLQWNATAAGVLIAVSQFIGALGRIVVGFVSDRVETRVGVLRWVAVSCVGVMLLLAGVGELHWSAAAAVVLILASTVTVADNGLAFTSVAEAAGPAWAGRALGVQNTGQFVAASAVGPGIGALIALVGYPLTFALVALAPLASLGLIPKRDQHWS
nr:MFS transporter [Microbacterium endophyticum]